MHEMEDRIKENGAGRRTKLQKLQCVQPKIKFYGMIYGPMSHSDLCSMVSKYCCSLPHTLFIFLTWALNLGYLRQIKPRILDRWQWHGIGERPCTRRRESPCVLLLEETSRGRPRKPACMRPCVGRPACDTTGLSWHAT